RSLFDYLAANPDEAATFAGAMVCVTRLETPALVRGYEWGAHTRVCDVGGGRGFLLGAVLAAHPRLDGILFDEADVVAGAREVLDSFGAGSRATIAAGSFFDAVPSGCDLYVLKEILHDWDDERAARILATVRRAMAPGARLAVIEMVLVDDERMHPAKLVDLQMMTATHRGRQRTREEFATLFAANGLRLLRVVELATLSSIVEAIAV
ncbi:MAG TPA: methyltransferase, partial [Polyangia bacterium]